MSRLHHTFSCNGFTLGATIDTAPGSTGLLIVSGGNEIRSGTFSGQAALAGNIAKAGFPVFRFDRRGVGDSDGENRGFLKSRPDIESALAAFRAMVPQMNRVIGFGNCDAASTLMLNRGAGCDGLVLSNPWTIENAEDDTPPPSAIRSRYLAKIRNPRELMRLIKGQVNLAKLARGVGQALKPKPAPSSLAQDMAAGIASFPGPVRILLASSDRTAQAFEASWDAADARIERCAKASHAYVEPHAREWLGEELLKALRQPPRSNPHGE